MVIVVDDEDRENEGDLVMAAENLPFAINFMAKYGRGLICLPMTNKRLDELKISDMVSDNTAQFGTALQFLLMRKRCNYRDFCL